MVSNFNMFYWAFFRNQSTMNYLSINFALDLSVWFFLFLCFNHIEKSVITVFLCESFTSFGIHIAIVNNFLINLQPIQIAYNMDN